MGTVRPVGVRSTFCSAGKSVNDHHPGDGQAGRGPEPHLADGADAATPPARRSPAPPRRWRRSPAGTCWPARGAGARRRARPSGWSTKRECRYTSEASVVTMTVSGTTAETTVKEKPSSWPGAHRQRDRGAERQQDGQERAHRAVEEERQRDHQQTEDREPADRRLPRLPLDPGLDVGGAHLADPGHRRERRGGHCPSIAASVASRALGPFDGKPTTSPRKRSPTSPCLRRSVVPAANSRSACAPSGVGGEARVDPPPGVERGHDGHPGHPGERRGERIGVDQRRRLERVVRLEQEQHDLPLGKDLLEVARRHPVRVVAHHQPGDRPLGRDACRQHGGRRGRAARQGPGSGRATPRSGRRCARVGCGKPPRADRSTGYSRVHATHDPRSVRGAVRRGGQGSRGRAAGDLRRLRPRLSREPPPRPSPRWTPSPRAGQGGRLGPRAGRGHLRADREGGAHPDSAGGGGAGAAALPRAARRRAQADPASRRGAEGTRAHRAVDAGGEEGARGQAGGPRAA